MDLRKYRRQTTIRLVVGGLLLLFTVGIGLIYLIYGQAAAISGVICMGMGLIPLAAIFLFFVLIDWILHRYRDE